MAEYSDYTVTVKTGDKMFAGTDANVQLVLHGVSGTKTKPISLDNYFWNDFEHGQTDIFELKKLPYFPTIAKLELWRDNAGLGSAWYLDRIDVRCEKSGDVYTFPIYRWIKAHYHYMFQHLDTSLPQHDPAPEQRKMETDDKKKHYHLAQKVPGIPLQVETLPDDEKFSFDYMWDITILKRKLILTSKIIEWTTGRWDGLEDLRNIYTKEIFVEPRGIQEYDSDVSFGSQRLAGVNHSMIKLCTEIPSKLAVTNEMLKPFLEGSYLDDALSSDRIFITDFELMRDIPTRNENFVICAPIGLFFVNNNKQLVPIAIQLYQDRADDNPVFLPSDPKYTWMMAKMWYNNADCCYHQSLTHLGFTHLIMEGISAVTHRNLSESHPVFRLLAPHFLYLIGINSRALEKLINPDGWINNTMNAGVPGLLEIVRRGFSSWKMNVHGTLPEELRSRGVLDDSGSVLPGYHFMEDALLLYNAIKTYVTKYLNLYYDTEKLANDWEIQNWRAELTGPASERKLDLKDVPGENGKFRTVDQLAVALTCIIYTCSVGHAAANFPQYDQYGYPPAYPGLLEGRPPKDKTPLTEDDILKSLPDKPTTLDIMTVTKILSTKATNSLGDFEVQYIVDPEAVKIVEEFKEDIRAAGKTIIQRNEERRYPYDYLMPDNIPNAISI